MGLIKSKHHYGISKQHQANMTMSLLRSFWPWTSCTWVFILNTMQKMIFIPNRNLLLLKPTILGAYFITEKLISVDSTTLYFTVNNFGLTEMAVPVLVLQYIQRCSVGGHQSDQTVNILGDSSRIPLYGKLWCKWSRFFSLPMKETKHLITCWSVLDPTTTNHHHHHHTI